MLFTHLPINMFLMQFVPHRQLYSSICTERVGITTMATTIRIVVVVVLVLVVVVMVAVAVAVAVVVLVLVVVACL